MIQKRKKQIPSFFCTLVVSKLNRDIFDSKRNPAETSSVGGKAKHTLAYTGGDTNLLFLH